VGGKGDESLAGGRSLKSRKLATLVEYTNSWNDWSDRLAVGEEGSSEWVGSGRGRCQRVERDGEWSKRCVELVDWTGGLDWWSWWSCGLAVLVV
jgi:hypothetical protein